MTKKTPEAGPTIELKIGRSALQAIVQKHLNDNMFQLPHEVIEIITHKQGDYGITVLAAPAPVIGKAEVTSED